MSQPDRRRAIPRTDDLLADPRLSAAAGAIGAPRVRQVVRAAQQLARDGLIEPGEVADHAVRELPNRANTLRPVLNATGVVLHTNLGRAALSAAAVDALTAASGYVDVEYDVRTGRRAARGRGALQALRAALPEAGDAMIVNNGAAALVLATTALAADAEVLLSRGEMVEIGAGFRLPDLIAATGARIREVGTTNRTNLADYSDALDTRTGCILKVYPSNFAVTGFTAAVAVGELARLGVPLIVDVGSGQLRPDPLLPDEPDIATALHDGATLVTASGDKLLGGPQAGLVLGDAATIERLRHHPLARALRVDKLTLAAFEATLTGPATPTATYLHADPDVLARRAALLAERVGGLVVTSAGAVGGGGAPGVELPGWAVALPEAYADALRLGEPCVVARVERGRTVVDLRCIPPDEDVSLAEAIQAAARTLDG